MSTNLSLQRRNELIETLNYLKSKVSSNEMLFKINLIEEELNKKKYGLVWEEHEEAVRLWPYEPDNTSRRILRAILLFHVDHYTETAEEL